MDESSGPPLEPHQRIGYAVAVVSLILGAGLMSGLTLGLLSMDVLDLQVRWWLRSATPSRKYLDRIAAQPQRAHCSTAQQHDSAALLYCCLLRSTQHIKPRFQQTQPQQPPWQVLRAVGSERDRKAATRLLSLVSRPHWLLVTLLVCNAACLEALPLFMNRLLDPATTLVLSVTAVLLFGEILPQAVCSRCVYTLRV